MSLHAALARTLLHERDTREMTRTPEDVGEMSEYTTYTEVIALLESQPDDSREIVLAVLQAKCVSPVARSTYYLPLLQLLMPFIANYTCHYCGNSDCDGNCSISLCVHGTIGQLPETFEILLRSGNDKGIADLLVFFEDLDL